MDEFLNDPVKSTVDFYNFMMNNAGTIHVSCFACAWVLCSAASSSNPHDFALLLLRADPRTGDWLLMQSPVPTLALSAAYLIVINLGTRFMKGELSIRLLRLFCCSCDNPIKR